ncbi:MAG: universal stress protein [Planctomycetia bacterium]|nr:universal stress protein [Planctomycetia bacterium]
MKAKKILFPTDFSTLSNAALEHATVLAKESGATLLVVHVAEPPAVYGAGEMYYGVPDPDTPTLRRMLSEIAPSDATVPCERRLLVGDPAAEIIAAAEAEHADMIVISTHGRTGLSRVLMGSVAELVVRRATCPVLTLKPSAGSPTTASSNR